MRDLQITRLMRLKAGLFLLLGGASVVLVWLEAVTLKTALLLALAVWSFCRAYCFAFYVLERNVDPGFKFSGLGSFVAYLVRRRKRDKGPGSRA